MASKLLNVLKTIEEGRQNCITALNEVGINVDENASLHAIAGSIEEYIEPITGAPTIHYVPGYDTTKETDPDVHLPEEFTEYPRTTLLQTTCKTISGKQYVPYNIMFFEAETATDLLCADTNVLSDQEGICPIGIANSGYIVSKNVSTCLVTSDGSEYVFNKDNKSETITHTWDASKDVLLNQKRYRWIIAYYYRDDLQGTADYIMHDTYITKPIEQLAFLSIKRGPYIRIHSIGCISYLTKWLQEQTNFANGRYGVAYITQATVTTSNTTPGIKCIQSPDAGVGTYYNWSEVPVTLVIPATDVQISSVPLNIIYLKCRTITNGNILTLGASQPPTCILKYVEVNPEAQRAVTTGYYPNWGPHIIQENVTENIAQITSAINDNVGYAQVTRAPFNHKVLNFAHLTNVTNPSKYTFSQLGNTSLLLPELTGTLPGTRNSSIKTILAPKVTTFSEESRLSLAAEYADLSSITQITTANCIVDVNTNSYTTQQAKLRYIDLSKLQTIMNNNGSTFRYLFCLEKIILPDGFKYSLNFAASSSLRKDTVLDLFNKCAQLSEGESYYITLPSGYKTTYLSSDEIAIATDKGWTVS